ncbi:MAG: alpha/beta fold hydrolase [Rubrivivax sp.]|nr:alpha/beta fold hydrolase [Rubrivivax sp.]
MVTTTMNADSLQASIRLVDIDGVSIRCRDSGGDGMPVLLTHGIGGSLELWNRQFDTPDPAWRLLAWDMPSHGLSGQAPNDTDLDAIARLGWRLLQALGVGPALLVGNSLGGLVSLRMAEQAPQQVRGLLLVACAGLAREVMLPFRLMALPGLGELMARPGPMAVKQQVASIVLRPASITPEVMAAIERNVMRPGGDRHFLALLRGLTGLRGQKAEVWQRSLNILRGFPGPVTLLHGEDDAVLPVAHTRQAHLVVPGAALVVLAGCGHTPQLEAAPAFQQALASLVQRAQA